MKRVSEALSVLLLVLLLSLSFSACESQPEDDGDNDGVSDSQPPTQDNENKDDEITKEDEKNNESDGEENKTETEEFDYKSKIDFPDKYWLSDGSGPYFSQQMRYNVYYPSFNDYATYADLVITDYNYQLKESTHTISIEFTLDCRIDYIYEGTDYFVLEIVVYDKNDVRIKTEYAYGEGENHETVRIRQTVTLSIEDVKNGITIKFCDHSS